MSEGLLRFRGRAKALLSGSVHIFRDAISPEQERTLLTELEPIFSRRRYQQNHWDKVIISYKEVERPVWNDPTNENTIGLIRRQIEELVRRSMPLAGVTSPIRWLPVHALELSAEGHITPHVDSVKFSGGLVCGLSLLSSAVMTLCPDSDSSRNICNGPIVQSDAVRELEGGEAVSNAELYLPRRSLYVLSGASRYDFAHSIERENEGDEREDYAKVAFGSDFKRGRRISLIFRDAK